MLCIYIEGGSFNSTHDVTRYEALAVILCTMDYAFEGSSWQTKVRAIVTQRGILDNTNSTNHAAALSYPAM